MINRDCPDTPLHRWYESHEVDLQKDLKAEGVWNQAQKKR